MMLSRVNCVRVCSDCSGVGTVTPNGLMCSRRRAWVAAEANRSTTEALNKTRIRWRIGASPVRFLCQQATGESAASLSDSLPKHDAVFAERRREVLLEVLPDERRAAGVAHSVDVLIRAGERDERGADVRGVLDARDHVALIGVRLIRGHFDLAQRTVAAEQRIEKRGV